MKKLIAIILTSVLLLSMLIGCAANDPIQEDMYIDGDFYQWDGAAWVPFITAAAGGGDVVGPAGATDDNIVTFNGVTGKLIQDSGSSVTDLASLWTTDANGIHYTGGVGIHTNASAAGLLALYSSDGISNDPILEVADNSVSAEAVGIRVNISGAKTDYTDGMYITNTATTNTAGAGKYGLRIKNTGNWLGAGSVNYGLFIEEPTGGTTNVAAQFGDGSDYVRWAADGTQTMVGDARTINTLWVDAGGIKAPGAKPATAISHGALETPAWSFANAILANQESVSFSMRIPERMDRSTAPTISIGWSSTTNAGNVKWQLEYLWRSADESTIAAGQETLTVTTTVSGVAEGLVSSEFTGIDIPSGTDICIHCKITRLSADAADTVADTVELHDVCYKWTSDKLGS